MTNQSDKQQSVRDVTGTLLNYEGDWHALFDLESIATGTFNERLLAWINLQLSASYTELNGAMAAYAISQGVTDWNSLGSVVAPFSPTDLGTDLMAWYDATDAGTITHAAGVVSQWNDKSTNVRHISQAGAATLRPTWNLSNAISFDGGDYLFMNTPFMYNNGGVAIYAVVTIPNSTGLALLAEGRSSTSTPLYVPVWTEQPSSSADVAMFVRNDASTTTYVGTSGLSGTFFDNNKKIVRFVDTGTTFTGYAAGVQAGVIAYARSGVLTLDRFAIGGLLRNTFGSGIIGSISEIIIVKNDTYGFEMEGYLANKHGL